MGKLRRIFQRSSSDYVLLFRTFMLMTQVRLGLRFSNFQTLLQTLGLDYPIIQTPASPPSLRTILWTVNCSSFYMPGNVLCLARALTTQVLLNRYGYTADLRIGVKRGETGDLQAHAWIEHHGNVIIGQLPELSLYIPLPSLTAVKL
jgi:hypothetical protein